MPELFVVQNPAAGMRSPARLRRRIESALAARGVAYEHAYTERPGHGAELVKQAIAGRFRRVLVVGGDGTVLETISALAGSPAALALLPVGTGNQLAGNLGVPKGLRRSVEVALNGRVRRIDVGLINGRPFCTMAGAGFDAKVVGPEPHLKRRLGYLAYVHAATLATFSPKPSTLRISIDGEDLLARGIGVEVANMPGLTAPGLRRPVPIIPSAQMDDGRLDGCLLAAETIRDCLSALGSIVTRRYERSPRLRYFSGREIIVEADPPLPVQADGEQVGLTPFVAKVWPGALNVMVPAR
ncbi:MAG: diacylglycerol kinase family lipid kinase [Gemmatimonadota bacterium]|nr:MAG: diacylglycerol kinase family lipid kinase [Gemmatimonadota bacterium]